VTANIDAGMGWIERMGGHLGCLPSEKGEVCGDMKRKKMAGQRPATSDKRPEQRMTREQGNEREKNVKER